MFDYKPQEQDYRIWLVVNPSVWLIPILAAVLVVALSVHVYAFSLPDQGWSAPEAEPVAVEETAADEAASETQPAAEEAMPGEEAAPEMIDESEPVEVVPPPADEPIRVEPIVMPETA